MRLHPSISLVSTLLLCQSSLSAQELAEYVGANVCAKCHPTEAQAQSSSAHALALSNAADHRSVFPLAGELVRPPRYRYRFRFADGKVRAVVSDSNEELSVPIDWALGAGKQAITFVGRLDADFYLEHYFSYYAATQSLAPTPGHIGLPANTLALASGMAYRSLDPVTGIVKCFECHSTGPPKVSAENEIAPAELGVRCEACHGPGSGHVEAASKGEPVRPSTLITNPGRLSAEEINQFCGRCHRTLTQQTAFQWNKAWNVRHQPVYLSQSACFLRSAGALSCLTCHNPHSLMEKKPADYDRICSTCHGVRKHTEVAGLETATCVECHIPRISPQQGLVFTNHWIGIYGSDNKLQPSR